MNILVIGKPTKDLIALLKQSKYAEKIYTASNGQCDEFPDLSYSDFDELIKKALALKIDIAINSSKALITQGITDAFLQSKINLISVNEKWLNLETSRLSAKKLLNHYNINTPKQIKTPLGFPIVIKTDTPEKDFVVFSMNELINKMNNLKGKNAFLEEYITGKEFTLYAIWDKKNLKYFYDTVDFTEVQADKLELIKTKLDFMFSDEKVDFIGIFGVKIIWYKNDWYITEFKMNTDIPESLFKNISKKYDFIYILNSAIYQKLYEL